MKNEMERLDNKGGVRNVGDGTITVPSASCSEVKNMYSMSHKYVGIPLMVNPIYFY